ncbi:MAG: TIR domain-containing protein, partial [Sphingomonas bacterium]|nr:TIR domain-containing protein [Sphingomonas bacterium]
MSNESARPSIFLSYAHDDRVKAQRLAAALAKRGYIVWWDGLIEGGVSFAKSIRDALEAADAVVVLWSLKSVDSDWVCDEAAQGRDRQRLVPLSLDGTMPPLGFGRIQTIDFASWNGKANAPQVAAAVRAIGVAIGQAPVEGKVQRITPGPPVDRRQAMLIAGSGAAVVGGGALFVFRDDWFGSGAVARSIAVLPFKNLSGDPGQAYLSDGLTEEVRSALAGNNDLQVVAATTSNTARDHQDSATAIAGKLGVAHLLDGSVQRSGDAIRVAVELTDGKTGFSIWAQRVDARLTDIFAFQTEIARIVSSALSVRMATRDPAPGGTRKVAAYEAYLRGKALYNLSKDEATDRKAKALYENAIAADPDFALAHAALSRVLSSIASAYAPGAKIKATFAAAVSEGRKAVALAPKLAEAHLALGYAMFAGQLDIKGSRASYDQAYRYGRGNADNLLLYALYTVRARRSAEAREAIERAVALDPLNPRTHRAAGIIGFATRDYDGAIGHFRRALELNPAMSNARAFLGMCLMQTGKLDEARAAMALEPSAMFRLTGLAILEHRANKRAEAQGAFDALVSQVGDAALYQQAQVMAQWQRPDDALALLQKARGVGDSGLTAIASDPLLDPIARDPRFK